MPRHRYPSLLAVLALSGGAVAQIPIEPEPDDEIGIEEHLGDRVPLDLTFRDEDGLTVTLGDYCDGDKPVIVTLVYYTCPGICNALLNGFTQTLAEMEWTAGEEFQIVTVSIDPTETPQLAVGKKNSYLSYYGRPQAEDGWRFLVGDEENIKQLAAAVGFKYRFEPGTGLYTHAAGLMICTPDGRLSRYLTDVVFDADTVELALTEASTGSIGSPVKQLLLKWCYTYDATSGKYVVAARKVMAIGGGITVLLTAAGIAVLLRREQRAKRDKPLAAGASV